MYLNKYIKLKRGDKKSIARMLKDCEEAIENGSSVLIFPEGTRSPDGQIKQFKPGAFILALKMKAPILPIVVSGTNAALPKYSVNFHGRTDIHIRVLEPIAYESFSHLSAEETAEMARKVIIAAHDEIKQQTSEISGQGSPHHLMSA